MIAGGLSAWMAGCEDDRSQGRQLIVLGFDGMDPVLCEQMMNEGRLPTLAKMRDAGGFRPLGTSTPPQSPVAWSSIITGTNPGKHGIFDFIHRSPDDYVPYASTSDTREAVAWYNAVLPEAITMGKYRFALAGGEIVNLRKGVPFWESLTEGGIPTQIYRMPANYPPTPSKGAKFQCLSDMGTPDIRGTNGEFSWYTEELFPKKITGGGGKAYSVTFINDLAKTAFFGPPDSTLDLRGPDGKKHDTVDTETALTIYRDPTDPTARLVWADQEIVLSEGDWSEWYPVEFGMGPSIPGLDAPILPTAKAICRFYLKQVRPVFQLYVSPLNIDPLDPSLPISQPDDFAAEVAEVIGRHYTQGLPEDTKALTNGILTREEFLQQADLVLQERETMFDFALDHFEDGFLFFYFGSTDQVGHLFWGVDDPEHPGVSDDDRAQFVGAVAKVYEEADALIAKTIKRFPDATVVVISDHGFDSFRRQFNPNNWLKENGYAAMAYPSAPSIPINFDFAKTKAYAMGINGLYINLHGRERDGIVPAETKQALMDEITDKLLKYKDPESGKLVIKEVYQADRIYNGPNVSIGPDLQIGYHRSFRGSWSAGLGSYDKTIMSNNKSAWNADHCIATDLVPGVMFSTRPLLHEEPTLLDVAPTILTEFELTIPKAMEGSNVFVRTPTSTK